MHAKGCFHFLLFYLPCPAPLCTYIFLASMSIHFVLLPMETDQGQWVKTVCWSLVGSAVGTQRRQWFPLSKPSVHSQPFRGKWQGQFLFHDWLLIKLTLCGPRAGNEIYCKLMIAMLVLSLPKGIFWRISPLSSSYFLPLLSQLPPPLFSLSITL